MENIKLWTFKRHFLVSLIIVMVFIFLGTLSSPEASSIGVIGDVNSSTVMFLMRNPTIIFALAKVILFLILLALYKPLKKIIER